MKTYSLQFGAGNPTGFSGLTPTFLIFYNLATSATLAPPTISETPAGWGTYSFVYGTTQPVWFLADAATTSPGPTGRYVTGFLDPADRADEYGNTMVALGNTMVALGNTILFDVVNFATLIPGIGSTASSMGGISTLPSDLMGYLRRVDALLEGAQQFVKGTGSLSQFDWTGATLLSQRTVTNSASLVTRT